MNMSSLRAVETRFTMLYVKCKYVSVFCTNIRDIFVHTRVTNTMIALKTWDGCEYLPFQLKCKGDVETESIFDILLRLM
jgi:hypothetical protein